MSYVGVVEGVPSFGQTMARNLSQGLSQGFSGASNFAKQMALEKQKGLYSAKLSKQLEKEQALSTGLETINEMRNLISSAGPSNWIQSAFGIGDVRQNRAQLESLGRSLIPLVSAGVPIRNQKEFEEYRKIITDPNSRQDDLVGALNGIESILKRSVAGHEASPDEETMEYIAKPTKKGLKGKKVRMRAPDGTEAEVDKSRVKDAMAAGAVVIK